MLWLTKVDLDLLQLVHQKILVENILWICAKNMSETYDALRNIFNSNQQMRWDITLNYYRILKVRSDATMNEIRVAYKKLAKKYHPDVTHSPWKRYKFKRISRAYNVLSNYQKRWIYDNTGKYDEGSETHYSEEELVSIYGDRY